MGGDIVVCAQKEDWQKLAKANFEISWLQNIIVRQAKELGQSDAQIEEMLKKAARKAQEFVDSCGQD